MSGLCDLTEVIAVQSNSLGMLVFISSQYFYNPENYAL